MRTVTLAYRDNDRTPVIFAIREMARRYYDIDLKVVQIRETKAYEAALFDGVCDVIIEHLEYLYERAMHGEKIRMFCAPSKGGGLALVVPQYVDTVDEFKEKTLVVRSSGQPHAVTLWLRMMGLEKKVATALVHDNEVGRWGQWKKVLTGESIATFISPIYLPNAIAAGLKTLAVPEVPIIGHFAQACLSEFTFKRAGILRDYVKAILHALAWLTEHRDEAFGRLASELKRSMKVDDGTELRRRFDAVVNGLKLRPYPTAEAVANTYEIASLEYPQAKGLNPLALWDLHWVRDLDDEGFIDDLRERMRRRSKG